MFNLEGIDTIITYHLLSTFTLLKTIEDDINTDKLLPRRR